MLEQHLKPVFLTTCQLLFNKQIHNNQGYAFVDNISEIVISHRILHRWQCLMFYYTTIDGPITIKDVCLPILQVDCYFSSNVLAEAILLM